MRSSLILPGILCVSALFPLQAAARQTLDAMLEQQLVSHPRIMRLESKLEATRHRHKDALGDWYPEIELKANYGNHDLSGKDGPSVTSDVSFKVTQKLWDFGETTAKVDKARVTITEAELQLQRARQSLLLSSARAYANLIRAHKILALSQQSEQMIQHQTELEQVREAKGYGYGTDVLQAKAKLAGATARRIRNEGEVIMAENDFREMFGRLPKNPENLAPLSLDIMKLLPESLGQALSLAGQNNVELQLATIRRQLAEKDAEAERSKGYYPKLQLSVEDKAQENALGVEGYKRELITKVELKMPFDLAFSAYNRVKASEFDASAEAYSIADKQRTIEKKVRAAWQRLVTAKANSDSLDQQAELSQQFLELARKERTLGKRSLADLLSNETALIDALSDSQSAKTDMLLASLTLLETIGSLQLSSIIQDNVAVTP